MATERQASVDAVPTVPASERPTDTWLEIQSTVKFLSELLEQCLAAFGSESVDKVISATTRKRLSFKALQGLRDGKGMLQGLLDHLNELQRASQQWERNILYASKSHKDLMEQLESTSSELHATLDRLRRTEAERLSASREAEGLKQQLLQFDADKRALEATLKQREAQLDEATFGAHEASSAVSSLAEQAAEARRAAQEAHERAEAAGAVLGAAREEAAKERAARERHEDAVARLTADNLVFLTRADEAAQQLAALEQERDALRAALDHQKGPWFDSVRAGVEARVKEAMARADALEAELTAARASHQSALEQLASEKADLEAFLGDARASIVELEGQLAAAKAVAAEATEEAERAVVGEARARREAGDRAAELRVAEQSLRGMREECNERWLSQQNALESKAALEKRLSEATAETAELQHQIQVLRDDLATRGAVNQQLMLKKEEVEWQLMAALAKLTGSPTAMRGTDRAPSGPHGNGSHGQLQLPHGSPEALHSGLGRSRSSPHQLPAGREGSTVLLGGVASGTASPARASVAHHAAQDEVTRSAFATVQQQQQQQGHEGATESLRATTPTSTAHSAQRASSGATACDVFSLPSLSIGIATLPPIMTAPCANHDPLSNLGTTGGLMAQFSPLHAARSGSIRGEVFPPCATAAALTEEEEAGLRTSGSIRLNMLPPTPEDEAAAAGWAWQFGSLPMSASLLLAPSEQRPAPAFEAHEQPGGVRQREQQQELSQQRRAQRQQQRSPEPHGQPAGRPKQGSPRLCPTPSGSPPVHPAMGSPVTGQASKLPPKPHTPAASAHTLPTITNPAPPAEAPLVHQRRHTTDSLVAEPGTGHASRDTSPAHMGWHQRHSDAGAGHSSRLPTHSILAHGGSRPGTPPKLIKRVSFSDVQELQGVGRVEALAVHDGEGHSAGARAHHLRLSTYVEPHRQAIGAGTGAAGFTSASHSLRGSHDNNSGSTHKPHAREPWTPPKGKAVHPIFGSLYSSTPPASPSAAAVGPSGHASGAGVGRLSAGDIVSTAAPVAAPT